MKKINIKKLVEGVSIAVVLGLLFAISSSLEAANDVQKKDYSQLSFVKAQALYHLKTNDFFNTKIKLLIDKKGSNKGDCKDEKDITTYCVASTATEEYFRYREALQAKIDDTNDTSISSGESLLSRYVKGDPASLLLNRFETDPRINSGDLFLKADAHVERVNQINQEINSAQLALDKTISAYNELRTAYPMHLDFVETIESLLDYKKQLKSLRTEIEAFPGKFHDATTTKCQ